MTALPPPPGRRWLEVGEKRQPGDWIHDDDGKRPVPWDNGYAISQYQDSLPCSRAMAREAAPEATPEDTAAKLAEAIDALKKALALVGSLAKDGAK